MRKKGNTNTQKNHRQNTYKRKYQMTHKLYKNIK